MGVDSVMNSVSEIEISVLGMKFSQVYCLHSRTNPFGKDTKPSIICLYMAYIVGQTEPFSIRW